MSEEQPVERVKIVVREERKETGPIHDATVEAAPKAGGLNTPALFLLFMVIAMVVVLVVINTDLVGGTSAGGVRADDPALAALKADLEARRTELNRQRIEANLPPLESGSEPIDDIGKRLKNDATALVALADRFQQMLGEKDAELSSRNKEILRSEQLRQGIAADNGRLRSELNQALASASEVDSLKRLVADSQVKQDAISAELVATREQLLGKSGDISQEVYADLERRFEETLRARNFFENRVKELEAEIGK
ncbi:MAG: hypothetical protein H7Y36_08195 [Armatimonadetes bacterium]|nr:hypothetical protein [Akkermansiaceae bacterium]